jgi:hypothetical protein
MRTTSHYSENYQIAVNHLESEGFFFRDHGGYIPEHDSKSEIVVGWTSANNNNLQISFRG